MTEQEWNGETGLDKMLELLTGRQQSFFACLCVRSVWELLNGDSKKAIMTLERYLLGTATQDDLAATVVAARVIAPADAAARAAVRSAYTADYVASVSHIAHVASIANTDITSVDYASVQERKRQFSFLREVANPFAGPLVLPPNPLSLIPRTMALDIREKGKWDELPILGDLLEELGAPESHIKHCYQGGHQLGCWLIEMLIEAE